MPFVAAAVVAPRWRGRLVVRALLAVCLVMALAFRPASAAVDDEEDDDDRPAVGAAAPAPQAPLAGQMPDRSDDDAPYAGPLWSRANLFGDPSSFRAWLASHGLTFGLSEQAEVLGNVSGGTRRGTVFEGLLSMGIGLDTEKAGLWPGGVFNASAVQIHGRGLSLNNLDDNAGTVSGIEALRGTLLYELWYEQSLFDKRVGIRIGQFAADQEFMVSTYGELFINHTFGWSSLVTSDLPSSGPSFPLAAPGIRVRIQPSPALAILAGVFSGDPARPGLGLPQTRDPSGVAFRLHDGVFAIAELQYATIIGPSPTGLPGTYKFGGWYHSGRTTDQRTSFGATLGDTPTSGGRRNNWSLYGIADQLALRRPGTKDEGVGIFARLMGAPGDRNLVNFYADAGISWKGALPGRSDDTAGIGFGLARISDTAIQADKELRTVLGSVYPLRRQESVLELTYQAQIAPWWVVQPTAQYLFDLNGGIPNPRQPSKRLGDAAVFGLRTEITF